MQREPAAVHLQGARPLLDEHQDVKSVVAGRAARSSANVSWTKLLAHSALGERGGDEQGGAWHYDVEVGCGVIRWLPGWWWT